MPILNVIKAQGLFETTVAVVRYFGGIKLGAGGLTRAYSSSAAEALAESEKCVYDMCSEILLRAEYPEVNALMRFLEGRCAVLGREFAADAAFTVRVREGDAASFCAELADLLNGKVQIFAQNKYFSAFPLEK